MSTDEEQLVESVAAAAQLATELKAKNDRLMESLRVIKKIKLEPSFGDLSLTYWDEWAQKALNEADRTIDTELRKHGIY